MGNQLAQLLCNGLIEGAIIAIAGIGLTLIFGILKIVNFAHGDYLTFGAYMAYAANVTLGIGIVAAAGVAVAATALLGIALELALWRPMRRRGAGMITLLIVSIGLALLLRNAILLVWGGEFHRYRVDVYSTHHVGSLTLSNAQIAAVTTAFAAILLVALLLAHSRVGKAMRALSDDRELAAVAGIDTDRIVLYTWLLGAALAGLAGFLQALLQSFFDPNMGVTLLLLIFAAVVLGGIGSAYGCLVGGVVLGVAMEVSTWDGFGGLSGTYKPVVAFVILALALLVRPQGLFGRERTV